MIESINSSDEEWSELTTDSRINISKNKFEKEKRQSYLQGFGHGIGVMFGLITTLLCASFAFVMCA